MRKNNSALKLIKEKKTLELFERIHIEVDYFECI